MRTASTILLGCCATVASAQLVNGSFEDGLNGWVVPDCHDAIIYAQWQPGLGASCLGLGISAAYGCLNDSPVQQFTPWITPGEWELRGWTAGNGIGAQNQGAYVQFKATTGYSAPIAALSGFDYTWAYHTSTFELGQDAPIDSLRLALYGDPGAMLYTWFDGLELLPVLSTGNDLAKDRPLPFRPNPATDKLWIDLRDTPLSITGFDGNGRMHVLKNFTHRDRTLEVDVHALPAGICLLRITTASGTHTVRFVKA